jgi:hypothetical protein
LRSSRVAALVIIGEMIDSFDERREHRDVGIVEVDFHQSRTPFADIRQCRQKRAAQQEAVSAASEIWALRRRLLRFLFAYFPECLRRALVFFLEELNEIRGIFVADRIGDFRNTGAVFFHQ